MPEEPASSPPAMDAVAETPPGRMTTIGRTLNSVIVVGRDLLARRRAAQPEPEAPGSAAALAARCRALLEHRGEASGLALASEIVADYQALEEGERLAFFSRLATEFEVDSGAVLAAADRYRETSDLEELMAIRHAVEAPRVKLFRRINTAPDGTRTLVSMRGHLLEMLRDHPELRAVEVDLKHQFVSWFNKGFLQMRRIDWSSPASVLEKIIAYEAVHEINGWDDLRSRLGEDRRCFAFFHPALDDDPVVFVEIALTNGVPAALPPLLEMERTEPDGDHNTVVFYSISNCHPGLSRISFGNFLIKSVIQELKKEMPQLDTFVTLSPVPGFRKWLLSAELDALLAEDMVERVREPVGRVVDVEVYNALLKLCAHYLLKVKSGRLPLDPVARFHLGNGAQLYRLRGNADLSAKGKEQSAGIMVNYLYDLPKIEENHDAYFDRGRVAASRAVKRMLD
ncbi:MAG: malonyl-CoA decarboxylase [Halioglobus sp.]|nr:malonyl-CoA decarboxylase [Halioglobus sp.]